MLSCPIRAHGAPRLSHPVTNDRASCPRGPPFLRHPPGGGGAGNRPIEGVVPPVAALPALRGSHDAAPGELIDDPVGPIDPDPVPDAQALRAPGHVGVDAEGVSTVSSSAERPCAVQNRLVRSTGVNDPSPFTFVPRPGETRERRGLEAGARCGELIEHVDAVPAVLVHPPDAGDLPLHAPESGHDLVPGVRQPSPPLATVALAENRSGSVANSSRQAVEQKNQVRPSLTKCGVASRSTAIPQTGSVTISLIERNSPSSSPSTRSAMSFSRVS